jgi:hypothetical protein
VRRELQRVLEELPQFRRFEMFEASPQSSGAVAQRTACQQNPSTVRPLGRIAPGFPQSRKTRMLVFLFANLFVV